MFVSIYYWFDTSESLTGRMKTHTEAGVNWSATEKTGCDCTNTHGCRVVWRFLFHKQPLAECLQRALNQTGFMLACHQVTPGNIANVTAVWCRRWHLIFEDDGQCQLIKLQPELTITYSGILYLLSQLPQVFEHKSFTVLPYGHYCCKV